MEHAELSRERFGRSSPFDLVNAVDLWLATGIGLLAAGLRLYGLGRKPLWYDEAFSVFIARQPLGRIGSLVAVNDAHPPLYYYVLHQWVGAFGSSELAVRGLSAVLGIAAAILTYAFVNGLRANRGEAGLAAALVAVSPLQILHSQEARMYPLLTVLVVLSWMALWHGIQRPNLISWALYVLFTTLMLYSHYYGFLVLGSQALCVLILPKARRLAGSWAMSAGVAAVLYIPWLPALLWQLQSGRGWPFYRTPLTSSLFADVLSVVVSGRPIQKREKVRFPGRFVGEPRVVLSPGTYRAESGATHPVWCSSCSSELPLGERAIEFRYSLYPDADLDSPMSEVLVSYIHPDRCRHTEFRP